MATALLPLARAEGRRLVRNPLVWIVSLAVVSWARSARTDFEGEDRWFLLLGYGFMLPGFVLVAAMVLAVLRGRIEHTEELLGTCAVGPDRRSIAHSLSALWGGALALLAIVVLIVLFPRGDSLGPWTPFFNETIQFPQPNLALYLQGPMALIAVMTFAVALVRWVPSWLVLAPLAFLMMVQGLFAGVFHGMEADGGRWLFPLSSAVVNGPWYGTCTEGAACELPVGGFDLNTAWWHLAYLAAVAVWCTVVAVLRHRRDRPAWTAFGAATVALLAIVVTQTLVATEYTGRA